MAGIMLVKQRVASIEQWNTVFREPELDGIRRRHGLVVTGTYVDATDPNTAIVVMEMERLSAAKQFASSPELAAARERAGAIGSPDGVWLDRNQSTADHGTLLSHPSHWPLQVHRRARLLTTVRIVAH